MNRTGYRLLLLAGPMLVAGCYNPYPYRAPYGQPAYGMPQQITPQTPGTLVIPQDSNAPLYEPERSPSTYDREESDDWNRSGSSGRFYEEDVPTPRDRDSGSGFDEDFSSGASTVPVDSTVAKPVSNGRQ